MVDEVSRVDVLGVPVTPGNVPDAVERVADWIRTDRRSFATFTGVHGVMESQRNPAVMQAHRAAGMVACDGVPLVWSSRWAGIKSAERVYGPDFTLAMCARAEADGLKSFFYGGKEGVAERLALELRTRYPKLLTVGQYSPPFRRLTDAEDAAVVEMINDSGADLVWVGLSTPKQELWMADHVGRLDAPALLGVGAAFDFLTGDVRQAPRWIHRTGLEWAFRLAMEPRRLASRYLRNNPAFIRAILQNQPKLLAGETP